MSASKRSIGSDLAKVDAYENSAAGYEEIPEITNEQFARAVRHKNGVSVRGRPPLDRPKKLVSIRLDQDVLDHYRNLGPGWQSQINAMLRQGMSES